MRQFRLLFRNELEPRNATFRDLALARSEAMREAGEQNLHDGIDGDAWVCLIFEDRQLVARVLARDTVHMPAKASLTPVRPEAVSEDEKLEEGLISSFPASDPPATVSTTIAARRK